MTSRKEPAMRIRTSTAFPWSAAALAAAFLLAPPASAQQQSQGTYKTGTGRQAASTWATEDNCAAKAQKAFPDHDAASNARREEARRNCMVNGSVRYGAPTAPATPDR
jgi:hypothetical protein